ncbi:MAG: type II toxin-antitoxin system HicB family antitoxin [Methanosarcina sp.]
MYSCLSNTSTQLLKGQNTKYSMMKEPYYGEVLKLESVWATGKTLEECCRNLEEVVDEWIVISLRLSQNPFLPINSNFSKLLML